MKKTVSMILTAVIIILSLTYIAHAEDTLRFVTIEEWLEAQGECGSCMFLLKIKEVLNPVLAIGEDETGTINLYSGGEDSIIIEFGNEERLLNGYWIVISNPKYNDYEGTIEMTDFTVLRMIPGRF